MIRGGVLTALAVMASGAEAAPLPIAEVTAPEINCVFDTDCSITVDDSTGVFTVGTTAGDAILQSRIWPRGEAGTPGAGLWSYLYRLDLTGAAGLTAQPCVTRLTLEFGPVERLDYDSDGELDSVFVVRTGGIGTVGPSAAEKNGGSLVFHFANAVCSGASVGAGDSSYFFGVASKSPPLAIAAIVRDSLGETRTVEARGADPSSSSAWWKNWQVWLVLVVVTVAGFLMMHRK